MRSKFLALSLAVLLAACAGAVAAAAPPGPQHSGHWYTPGRSGEGWMLEILSPQQALLYWFTYDDAGRQRWLTSVGRIDAGGIDFDPVVLTTGGRFGPGFDPGQIVHQAVGRARAAQGLLNFPGRPVQAARAPARH